MQKQWGAVDYRKSLTVTPRRQARSNTIWSIPSPSFLKTLSYIRRYFWKISSCGSPSNRAGVFDRWLKVRPHIDRAAASAFERFTEEDNAKAQDLFERAV
jgi:hypothetical protein